MQPGTWMNRRLAAYRNLSIQEKRAIRDFALLWSFFEEIWLGNWGNVPRIRQEVEARLTPNASMTAFDDALAYFRNRYVSAGNPTESFAHLSVSPNDRQDVLDVLSGQTNEPRRVLTALLIIAYRLRNNFFHGEKAGYGYQGQLENFQHANAVLMHTMDL
jgi:hypothetical protein